MKTDKSISLYSLSNQNDAVRVNGFSKQLTSDGMGGCSQRYEKCPRYDDTGTQDV